MQRYYRIDLPAAPNTHRPTLVSVTTRSSKQLRLHVERFARYFLREMNAGGLPFEASESELFSDFVPYKAFLFTSQGRYVGAACFRYREDQDPMVPWLFQWLWLHPFCRRRGVLTATWTELKTQVGEFRYSQPISLNMQAFLRERGDGAA